MKSLPLCSAALASALFALGACTAASGKSGTPTASASALERAPADISTFFEQYDAASLALSPESKAYRGIRDADYGLWDDPSAAADDAAWAQELEFLAQMRSGYDLSALSGQDALSYRLFEADFARTESAAALSRIRLHLRPDERPAERNSRLPH